MDAIYKKAKDYFVYTLLSWDDAVSKVENRAENVKYLGDGEYKKEIIKYINKARSNHKITYFENKKTSTSYNVCEKPDGEIVIVFRGSDSKIDWISDFLFFKQKFENENKELFITMSNEDFENLAIDEYIKSVEDADISRSISVIRNTTMVPIDSLIDRPIDSENDNGNPIETFFNFFRGKIKIHGGFFNQYASVAADVNSLIDTYVNNPKVKSISIVGHSLGSSLAQICNSVQHIRHPRYTKFNTYIYGTPRIGGKVYLDFLIKSKIINKLCISNIKGDICNALPPTMFGFVENQDTVILEPLKVGYFTKMNHTLFYYLYCFYNDTPHKINRKYYS